MVESQSRKASKASKRDGTFFFFFFATLLFLRFSLLGLSPGKHTVFFSIILFSANIGSRIEFSRLLRMVKNIIYFA